MENVTSMGCVLCVKSITHVIKQGIEIWLEIKLNGQTATTLTARNVLKRVNNRAQSSPTQHFNGYDVVSKDVA